MAKTNFKSAARELKALNEALRAVAEHTKNVSRELVGGLESAVLAEIDVFQKDVQRRLDDSTAKVQGLANFLSELGSGGVVAPAKRGPGRPKGSVTKRKKGRRGVRVELRHEELAAAMELVLEGLHQASILSKDRERRGARYADGFDEMVRGLAEDA